MSGSMDAAMVNPIASAIATAAAILSEARHAVAFTGAGISTPSGVPDFRSKNSGMWEKYDPMEVASIGSFRATPARFYDWLRPLLHLSLTVAPNPAHTALAQMEEAGILKAVITQNIDDLHQRAGSLNIYEVHGSLRTMTCPGCLEVYPSGQFLTLVQEGKELPRCPRCKKVLKPDITLFGELLPQDTWEAAEEHCRKADVVLVAGSSLSVWPASALPEMGVQNGARLIINNLTPTHLDSSADVLLPVDVAEALPRIARLAIRQ
jgi:NAD-dependent deacetylase